MDLQERIDAFLEEGPWAVAGASNDRSKFGNKVLRSYQQDGRAPVYPLNPSGGTVEGLTAYARLADVPEPVRALSVVTPPPVTERIAREALEHGVRHVWMQPGAESDEAVLLLEQGGVSVIHGGPCLLVALGFRG